MNKYKSSRMMAMKLAKLSVAAALTAGMVFSTSSYVLAQEVTKLRMTALAGQATDGLQAALKIWNEQNPSIQVELQSEPFDPWGTTVITHPLAACADV